MDYGEDTEHYAENRENTVEDGEIKEVDEENMISEDLEHGDIEMTETQKIEFQDEPLMRSGAIAKKYMWPKTKLGKFVYIPYVINEVSSYSK